MVALASLGLLIFLSGCAGTQPQFNSTNKGVLFLNSKPYAIPYGASYMLLRSNDEFSKNMMSILRSAGKKCRYGKSLIWMSPKFKEYMGEQIKKINREVNKGKMTKEQGLKVIKNTYLQAVSRGLFGCSNPLSDREYKYYMNMMNQQAANARAAAYYQANTAPKYVNVNHTGFINYFGY